MEVKCIICSSWPPAVSSLVLLLRSLCPHDWIQGMARISYHVVSQEWIYRPSYTLLLFLPSRGPTFLLEHLTVMAAVLALLFCESHSHYKELNCWHQDQQRPKSLGNCEIRTQYSLKRKYIKISKRTTRFRGFGYTKNFNKLRWLRDLPEREQPPPQMSRRYGKKRHHGPRAPGQMLEPGSIAPMTMCSSSRFCLAGEEGADQSCCDPFSSHSIPDSGFRQH